MRSSDSARTPALRGAWPLAVAWCAACSSPVASTPTGAGTAGASGGALSSSGGAGAGGALSQPGSGGLAQPGSGGLNPISTGGAQASGSGGTSASDAGGAPSSGGSNTGGEFGKGGSGTGGATGSGGASGTATGGALSRGGSVGAGGNGGAGAPGSGGQGGAAELTPIHVYIAGDSTVQTYTDSAIHQAGWGQFLQKYLDPRAKVANHAIGGRTARRFIDEGYLAEIIAKISAGDYLLVQFGTNDGNKTATYTFNGMTIPYYLDPQTDFKTWLRQYVTQARARSAVPVFVTPPPRMSCTEDSHTFGNGLAAYATAMKEMGAADGILVVDLNQQTLDYLNGIGCVAAGKDFFLIKADGTNDSTHFQERGADRMASFVSAGLRSSNSKLSAYVK